MRWVGAIILVACVSDSASVDGGPKPGDLGGPCYDNATCNAGLVCVLPNKCAYPDGGASDVINPPPVDAGGDGDAPSDPLCLSGLDPLVWWTGDDTLADHEKLANLTGSTTFTTGMVGKGFNINAIATDPQVSAAGLPLSKATIELWLKPTASPTNARVVELATSGMQDGWGLGFQTGALEFFATGAGIATGPSVTLTAFTHVAVTYEVTTPGVSGLITIYVNGLPGTPVTNSGKGLPAPASPILRIGADIKTGTLQFNGVVDEVSIYSDVLSAASITAIYNAGLHGKCK